MRWAGFSGTASILWRSQLMWRSIVRLSPSNFDAIDREVSGVRDGREVAAAEKGVDASDELAHAERLRDVVVGAELEADHLVGLLGAGREHEDWRRRVTANDPADLEAAHIREHYVEKQHVRLLFGDQMQGSFAAGGAEDGKP